MRAGGRHLLGREARAAGAADVGGLVVGHVSVVAQGLDAQHIRCVVLDDDDARDSDDDARDSDGDSGDGDSGERGAGGGGGEMRSCGGGGAGLGTLMMSLASWSGGR